MLPDSVLVGVRQQRQEARALHGDSELPLVEGLRAGNAARHDLARLGDVTLEGGKVLVVDVLHAFGGEAAELLPAGEAAVRGSGFHSHGVRSLSVVGRAVVVRRAIVTARCALATRRAVVIVV